MRILAIGEVLWDIFEHSRHIGGAPFNVAAHLSRLGADAYLLSGIGEDSLGSGILTQMQQLGVYQDFVNIIPDRPSGTVDVFLQNGQPDYEIHENVAWDALYLTKAQMHALTASTWDAVVFGSLAQRTENNLQLYKALLSDLEVRESFFDVNMRKNYCTREILRASLHHCTIFKLNDIEVGVCAAMLYQKQLDPDAFAERISADFDVPVIVVTLGAEGAYVFDRGRSLKVPGQKVEVVDTVGAGDSFSAGFLLKFLVSRDIEQAARTGCMLGAYTASQSGAIPEYSVEIRQQVSGR